MKRTNIPRREAQPLPATKTVNGIAYRLDPETETYKMDVPQQQLGPYAQQMMKMLVESFPIPYNAMIADGTLMTFLIEEDARLWERREQIIEKMKKESREPENYNERVRWLDQLSRTAEEIVREDMNETLLSLND